MRSYSFLLPWRGLLIPQRQHRDLVELMRLMPWGKLVEDPQDGVFLEVTRRRRSRRFRPAEQWWEVLRVRREEMLQAMNAVGLDVSDETAGVVFDRFVIGTGRSRVVVNTAAHMWVRVDDDGGLIYGAKPRPQVSRAQRRSDRRFALATGALFASAQDLAHLIAQLERALAIATSAGTNCPHTESGEN
jgi:hypothetical protein